MTTDLTVNPLVFQQHVSKLYCTYKVVVLDLIYLSEEIFKVLCPWESQAIPDKHKTGCLITSLRWDVRCLYSEGELHQKAYHSACPHPFHS